MIYIISFFLIISIIYNVYAFKLHIGYILVLKEMLHMHEEYEEFVEDKNKLLVETYAVFGYNQALMDYFNHTYNFYEEDTIIRKLKEMEVTQNAILNYNYEFKTKQDETKGVSN